MAYAPLTTDAGLRDLAQKCFRIAAAAKDETLSRELVAFGNELMKEIEPIAVAPDAPEDHQHLRDPAPALIVLSLADLRRLLRKTQREIAAALSVQRNAVSKLEKRQNVSVSSLRGYLGAMGAKLQLVASFPDRSRIFIENLGPKANHSCRRSRRPLLPETPLPALAGDYSHLDD